MKKLVSSLIASIVIVVLTGFSGGCAHGYGEYYRPDYGPRGDRHVRSRSYERRIIKEIRHNERRIVKLERKIRKYHKRKRYVSRRKARYYSRIIGDLEREVRHLEHRNRELRRKLR